MIVSVALAAEALVTLTGVVDPKLRVGIFCAPAGLFEMTAVKATFPVKPLTGVTEMADVFPVVAPAGTVTGEPLTEKLAGDVAVMVTVAAADVDAAKFAFPP